MNPSACTLGLTASVFYSLLISPQAQAGPQLPSDAQILGACLTITDEDEEISAKQIAVARLGGQFEADILTLLDNGQLNYCYQPARWRSDFPIASGRLALASLARPLADRDIAVTTGPGGLLQHHYSQSTGASTTLLSADWADVTCLFVDQSGVLLGLDSVAKEVLRFELESMTSLPASSVPADTLQIASLRWDSDSTEDLVYRTASEVAVLDGQTGVEVWSEPAVSIHDRIVVVRGLSGQFDDILARTRYFVGVGTFLQCVSANDQDDSWFNLGSYAATALSSGDVANVFSMNDPDGVDDLLAGASNSPEVLVFQRNTTMGNAFGLLMAPNFFDTIGQGYFRFSQLGTTQLVQPDCLGVGDLDVDGDLDVAFRGGSSLATVLGWQMDNRLLREDTLPHSSNLVISQPGGVYTGNITWTGDAPVGATHIQATVMVHEAGYATLVPTPIPQGGLSSLLIPLNNQTLVHSGVLNLATTQTNPIWNIIYRSVKVEANGSISKAWPTLTYICESPSNPEDTTTWPEVEQAALEFNLLRGAGTHGGGSQSSTGRPPPPVPVTP